MYSPKIPPTLIPTIHHLARSRGVHMTRVVAEALTEYVARQDLTPIAEQIAASERQRGLCANGGHRADNAVVVVRSNPEAGS